MNLTIVATPSSPHQMAHARALQAGLKRHGLLAPITHSSRAVRTDAVACWGWRQGEGHRAAGRRVLVMERGYIGDRFAFSSLGWNGLNGRARFGEPQDNGERFQNNFGHLLRAWNPSGSYVLLIGQVPGDAALGGRCLQDWYAEQALRCKRLYGLPVRFRAHPLAARRGGKADVPGAVAINGDLHDALAGAALVVTFNSNTGVESLLAGKPTVALDEGSMVWGMASPTLPPSLVVSEPPRIARFERMAWCQFTLPEIESGFAWEVVRDGW